MVQEFRSLSALIVVALAPSQVLDSSSTDGWNILFKYYK